MIRFLETRELIGGEIVTAGEERSFSPEEEAAFIGNGVAVDATAKTTNKKADAAAPPEG